MNKQFILVILICLTGLNSSGQQCICKEYSNEEKINPEILIQSPDNICKAKGYEEMAAALTEARSLDSAELMLSRAGKIYEEAGCKGKPLLGVYRLWSRLYYLKADYQRALDYSLKDLEVVQSENNPRDEAEVLLNISQVFARMGQTDKALAYARQAVPFIIRLKNDPAKTDILNKAGARYYFLYQDTKVKELLDSTSLFFRQALEIARLVNYRKGMQTSYNKMNSLAYQEKNYPLALQYIDSSLALSVPGEISTVLAASYGDKGNILLKMGRFSEAKIWADSCLYYNTQMQFPPLIANAYSLVAEIADSLGDHKTAYAALYAEKKITDSLNTADKAKAVSEVEKKYNQAKNEKTIKELNQQKQIYILLAVAGVLIAGLIAFLFRQQALKNKQKILETEQRLNRARMNPHFFFNALTALQRIALRENDGKALASNLSKFSNIMRETLESTYKEYVTVRQEVEFLKEYLEIQRMRFPDMFNYQLMVDGEMDTGDVVIPSMILQPFIENSIEHGFAGIDYPGEIRVDFKQTGNTIQIEITDNGKGLATVSGKSNEHISRASQIIKDRIYLLNIKLKTKASFSIDNNKQGKGVLVTIGLPLIYADENTADR